LEERERKAYGLRATEFPSMNISVFWIPRAPFYEGNSTAKELL
jgi:hypothetical protein